MMFTTGPPGTRRYAARLPDRPLSWSWAARLAPPTVYKGPSNPTKGVHVGAGTVKWFNATKGFGFISPADGGADLFVHRSEIQDYDNHGLADEQRVEFEVAQGRKGLQATAVRIVQ